MGGGGENDTRRVNAPRGVNAPPPPPPHLKTALLSLSGLGLQDGCHYHGNATPV